MRFGGLDYPNPGETFTAPEMNRPSLPHVAHLSKFAAKLRREGKGKVPDFDPLDGGAKAQVLFLFEKPGPTLTRARKSSLSILAHKRGCAGPSSRFCTERSLISRLRFVRHPFGRHRLSSYIRRTESALRGEASARTRRVNQRPGLSSCPMLGC
jgi:hypothetical protein